MICRAALLVLAPLAAEAAPLPVEVNPRSHKLLIQVDAEDFTELERCND